jgi:glycosyltransferase involved in cell wall biosynthesis
MMDLIVNGVAARCGSMGTRRYYSAVMQHLGWPSRVEETPVPGWPALRRPYELTRRGRRDAIFWSPAQRGPLRAHHHVITVLDCISLEYSYRGDWRVPAYRALFNQILDGAQAVVTISRATRDSLFRNYRVEPRKVTVIALGTDSPAEPDPGEVAVMKDVEAPPFVLMVTNGLPHKNTMEACRALVASQAASRNVSLVVAGSTEPGALELCRSAGISVEAHPFVDDAQLSRLYRTCQFLFSPSLDEGYNLPVAEAIVRGANVLCSDIAVHREFFEGKARMFDPSRVEAMTDALDRAFDLPGRWFRSETGSRQRTFVDVAADYRSFFESISAEGGR